MVENGYFYTQHKTQPNSFTQQKNYLFLVSIYCSQKLISEFSINLERTTGIEPASSAWEADILPMNYVRATNLA